MKPLTEEHLAIYRRHMVEIIEMHFELSSDELELPGLGAQLRRALSEVPRHLFVPPPLVLAAYQDMPLPIGFDKTISQPFIGAAMIALLGVEEGSPVLEVGTGYGYQAAVMAEMGALVWSVEIVEEFAEAAQARFAALGYPVQVRVGDGSRGWADHAPFDRILVTAAAETPPAALLEQLAPGGRMVIPLDGDEVQQLSVVTKAADGAVFRRAVMAVHFTRLEDP